MTALLRMADLPQDEFGPIASLDWRQRAADESAAMLEFWAQLAAEEGDDGLAESLASRAEYQRLLAAQIKGSGS